jgi:hypothetical protein
MKLIPLRFLFLALRLRRSTNVAKRIGTAVARPLSLSETFAARRDVEFGVAGVAARYPANAGQRLRALFGKVRKEELTVEAIPRRARDVVRATAAGAITRRPRNQVRAG